MNVQTWAPAYFLSAGAISHAIKKSRADLSDRQVPRLGVMAAFIFAAQMVNFPVAGVASGHLLGAALAAIMLGPWSACLVISTVLVIQMLIFQDGGLAVLGANIFNMSVMGVFSATLVFRLLSRIMPGSVGRDVAVSLASWASVMVTAAMASLELGLSHNVHLVPFKAILTAMAGWHAVIGIGEGLITVVVVRFMDKLGFSDVQSGGTGVSRE